MHEGVPVVSIPLGMLLFLNESNHEVFDRETGQGCRVELFGNFSETRRDVDADPRDCGARLLYLVRTLLFASQLREHPSHAPSQQDLSKLGLMLWRTVLQCTTDSPEDQVRTLAFLIGDLVIGSGHNLPEEVYASLTSFQRWCRQQHIDSQMVATNPMMVFLSIRPINPRWFPSASMSGVPAHHYGILMPLLVPPIQALHCHD